MLDHILATLTSWTGTVLLGIFALAFIFANTPLCCKGITSEIADVPKTRDQKFRAEISVDKECPSISRFRTHPFVDTKDILDLDDFVVSQAKAEYKAQPVTFALALANISVALSQVVKATEPAFYYAQRDKSRFKRRAYALGKRPLDSISIVGFLLDVRAAWKEGWQGTGSLVHEWLERHGQQGHRWASFLTQSYLPSCIVCSLGISSIAKKEKEINSKVHELNNSDEVDWKKDFNRFKANLFQFCEAVGVLGLLDSDMPCEMIPRLQKRAQYQKQNASAELAKAVLRHERTIGYQERAIQALKTRHFIEQLMYRVPADYIMPSKGRSGLAALRRETKHCPSKKDGKGANFNISPRWDTFWVALWEHAVNNTKNPFHFIRKEVAKNQYAQNRTLEKGSNLFKDTSEIIHNFNPMMKPEHCEGFGKEAREIMGVLQPIHFLATADGNYKAIDWKKEVQRFLDGLPPLAQETSQSEIAQNGSDEHNELKQVSSTLSESSQPRHNEHERKSAEAQSADTD